jgi:hypothetical protein
MLNPEAAMRARDYDEWTIDRWRVEPRWRVLDIDETPASDVVPPLWKDLAVALAVALALWLSAMALVM